MNLNNKLGMVRLHLIMGETAKAATLLRQIADAIERTEPPVPRPTVEPYTAPRRAEEIMREEFRKYYYAHGTEPPNFKTYGAYKQWFGA